MSSIIRISYYFCLLKDLLKLLTKISVSLLERCQTLNIKTRSAIIASVLHYRAIWRKRSRYDFRCAENFRYFAQMGLRLWRNSYKRIHCCPIDYIQDWLFENKNSHLTSSWKPLNSVAKYIWIRRLISTCNWLQLIWLYNSPLHLIWMRILVDPC